MTYQEYLELKAKRAGKLKEGEALLAKKDFDGHKALMGEVSKMNQELDAAEAQLAEEGRFDEDDEGKMCIRDSQQPAEEGNNGH